MLLKGLQGLTLLDFPGKVACIVFVGGCNFRCPFCQNPELVLHPEELPTIAEDEFFKFLKARVGFLDGVVITGGEPTIYSDLPEFLKKVKDLGFLVKVDTNGTNPEMVEKLVRQKLIDYVAMDYKGPLGKYYKYIGQSQNSKVKGQSYKLKVKRTIEILLKNKIDFELRTTVVPTLHTKEDLIEMVKEIKNLSPKWFLQPFRPNKCLDKSFEKIKPYPREFFAEVLPALRKYLPKTEIRGT